MRDGVRALCYCCGDDGDGHFVFERVIYVVKGEGERESGGD